MKRIMDISVTASGSPSAVKHRIDTQLALIGASEEQAPLAAAARGVIEKAIAGVSEDDTLHVAGQISIVITDAPPVVAAAKPAEQSAELQAAEKRIVQLEQKLEAVGVPVPAPED